MELALFFNREDPWTVRPIGLCHQNCAIYDKQKKVKRAVEAPVVVRWKLLQPIEGAALLPFAFVEGSWCGVEIAVQAERSEPHG